MKSFKKHLAELEKRELIPKEYVSYSRLDKKSWYEWSDFKTSEKEIVWWKDQFWKEYDMWKYIETKNFNSWFAVARDEWWKNYYVNEKFKHLLMDNTSQLWNFKRDIAMIQKKHNHNTYSDYSISIFFDKIPIDIVTVSNGKTGTIWKEINIQKLEEFLYKTKSENEERINIPALIYYFNFTEWLQEKIWKIIKNVYNESLTEYFLKFLEERRNKYWTYKEIKEFFNIPSTQKEIKDICNKYNLPI